MNRYRPWVSVTDVISGVWRAGLEIVTVTPGKTPPDSSVTLPSNPESAVVCAKAGVMLAPSMRHPTIKAARLVINSLLRLTVSQSSMTLFSNG